MGDVLGEVAEGAAGGDDAGAGVVVGVSVVGGGVAGGGCVDADVGIGLAPPAFGAEVDALAVVERNAEAAVVALRHALTISLAEFWRGTGQHARPCGVVTEPIRVGAVLNTDVLT